MGADKGFDVESFVEALRERKVTPHIAIDGHLTKTGKRRKTAIDGRTLRHPGYAVSQCCRKRIEEVFGWIKVENDLVSGLRLDGTIPLAHAEGIFAQPHLFAVKHIFLLGARTGLLIRLAEGHGVMVKELAAAPETDSSEIAFATPFAPPDGLEPDCLVASGRLSQEYHRMIVFGIEPNADLTTQITFVDEAPELFQ